MTLRLDTGLRDQLRGEAQAAYPKECCGLLIGRDAATKARNVSPDGDLVVTRVLPSINRDPAGGARAFEVDTELILTWHKRLRGTPERILGHYHSHPDQPARPSATDLDRAWEPGMVWLILSVGRGKRTEIAAFRYEEEGRAASLRRGFAPLELVDS
jgi:proteasome lid subunit RPN8/RPN11